MQSKFTADLQKKWLLFIFKERISFYPEVKNNISNKKVKDLRSI